ncbi:MAG TPA: adenylyltransferase/cytidyltransferase family protein [Candidatus Pacearchaeota archaeon]|nr:adenylyltransferase/cytidyltransferase family protein [Candidatus Pacearchaeota archaeon]
MTQINFEDLNGLRTKFKDKKIVFCSGSFDLTHAGHILFFEDCKKFGDILIVSVGGDKLLKKNKGDLRPILNENIRLKTIDSLKPVDYCFIEPPFDNLNTLYGLEKTFNLLRPNIYVINEDAFNIEYRKDLCKRYNVILFILERHCPKEFEGISTTKIIDKIKSLKDISN